MEKSSSVLARVELKLYLSDDLKEVTDPTEIINFKQVVL
jgi:hypothetical protein